MPGLHLGKGAGRFTPVLARHLQEAPRQQLRQVGDRPSGALDDIFDPIGASALGMGDGRMHIGKA